MPPSACCSLSLGLAGCALTRPPAQVEAPFPAQWHAPLPHGGSLASLADWWRQLDDPLLVELIAAAEAASPNVASAAARVAEARSTRVQAGAALLPSLDGTASASRGPSGFAGGAPTTGSSSSSAGSRPVPPAASYLGQHAHHHAAGGPAVQMGDRPVRPPARRPRRGRSKAEQRQRQVARRPRVGGGRNGQRLLSPSAPARSSCACPSPMRARAPKPRA
jgi:hypothetical protein